MFRLSYFGILLGVALLVQSSIAQPVAQEKATTKHAMVQHVVVRDSGKEGGKDIEVEIQTSGAAPSPNTQVITGPDRIVVDFPGTVPSSTLRALNVNRGVLKSIRSGLFFNDPPITRIVLDLSAPQSYQISTIENAIVVKLAAPVATGKQVAGPSQAASPRFKDAVLSSGQIVPAPHLSIANVSVKTETRAGVSQSNISNTNLQSAVIAPAIVPAPPASKPLNVTYENGMLRIHAEKVTLAQILFEVHLRTQAEIAVPAGAEQEQVMADLGPAPARDVLGALLNGSPYNFIFVGNELSLERVILTRKDSTNF